MEYEVVKSRRRTLALEIKGDRLVVRAPLYLPSFAINKFVTDRADWIDKHLKKYQDQRTIQPGKIMLHGKVVDIKEILDLPELADSKQLRSLKLKRFLSRETKKAVAFYLNKFSSLFGCNEIFKVRMYKSKWGSCSARDELAFSGRLAMVPDEVVEYVVVHELCHILVKNHSRRFWSKVEELIPDYKLRRKWLRDNHGLLNYENR